MRCRLACAPRNTRCTIDSSGRRIFSSLAGKICTDGNRHFKGDVPHQILRRPAGAKPALAIIKTNTDAIMIKGIIAEKTAAGLQLNAPDPVGERIQITAVEAVIPCCFRHRSASPADRFASAHCPLEPGPSRPKR